MVKIKVRNSYVDGLYKSVPLSFKFRQWGFTRLTGCFIALQELHRIKKKWYEFIFSTQDANP